MRFESTLSKFWRDKLNSKRTSSQGGGINSSKKLLSALNSQIISKGELKLDK